MICSTCQATFNQSSRDKNLQEDSDYLSSSLCLTCITTDLQAKQAEIYPKLLEISKEHEKIKEAYFASTKKLAEISKKFKSVDYERNIITHNVKMEKERQKKKPAKSNKPTKSIKEQIQAMLANLSKDQRDKVLANFAKLQSS